MPRVTYHPYKRRRVQRKGKPWFRSPDEFKDTKPGKRGKYNSVSATYDGRTYHSRAEALYAAELDTLKRAYMPADRVVSWEPQVKVSLDVNGQHITNYYCDFVVHFADGRTEWHEVKGYATAEWLLKEKLFRAIYPDRILKVIKV